MSEHSGQTQSVWMTTAPSPDFPELKENTTCDVCVVGAGISGLSTAYMLALEGKKVVVIDDGPLGAGETERTTAHLSDALDDRYTYLERRHGEEGARLAAESHSAAISEIETIVQREGIDCEFTRLDGFLFVPSGVSPDILRDELEAAQRAGLHPELTESPPYQMYGTKPCLRFPRQGQFHPLAYLRGLMKATQSRGGQFFKARAMEMQGGKNGKVSTESGRTISCGAVVVATNTPVNDRVVIHTKQAPYRTYAVGIRIPAGVVPRALYWDTAQDAEEQKMGHSASYHYVRTQPLPGGSEELLIVGGEDHKTAQAEDLSQRWARLEKWTHEHFPQARKTEYRWSGQVMEPVDGMAFIGVNPGEGQENVYVATGDSGHGMTHGTIAGILIRDLILGRKNSWAKLYDPSRKTMSAAGDFLKENLNVAAQYGELLTGGDDKDLETMGMNTGRVVRRGTTKIAVYRDEKGTIHEFSAICPHLKCVVHWNSVEKSWDCPCHGSRFSRFGEVLNGPSLSGLERVDGKKE